MSSSEAPRCRHVKVNGTQCGSPAVRSKSFCYYHQQHRPILAECYSDGEYSTGEILLPVFKMRTPLRPSFARECRWLCKKESNNTSKLRSGFNRGRRGQVQVA